MIDAGATVDDVMELHRRNKARDENILGLSPENYIL